MSLTAGTRLGPYEILGLIGAIREREPPPLSTLLTPPPPPVVTHINLIQNWFEEVKAKVPGGVAKETEGQMTTASAMIPEPRVSGGPRPWCRDDQPSQRGARSP